MLHNVTVANGLLGDPGCVLSVTPFVQFNTALAVSSAIHTEHAQIPNVNT
jgi:hypothetical protein